MASSDIACERPRIVINPSLPELLSWSNVYFIKGRKFVFREPFRHKDDFEYYRHMFSPRRNRIDLSDVDSCYLFDEETGETKPLYMVVPCGHCSVCRLRKMNSFVKRCEYESEMYDSFPWFVTLTYADEFLPADGVSVRDCQLFLKRFRINLFRSGFKDLIRYVIVSEYGDDEFDPKLGRCHTQRPHYHCIFWNIRSFTDIQVKEVSSILKRSWPCGFVTSRLIRPNDDDKGMFYTFKYSGKETNVPEGKNKNFVLSSRRGGGIGSGFIDKVSGDIRSNLDASFVYRSRFHKSLQKFVFMPYALNRIFPTFSRSVSYKFRDAVVRVVALGQALWKVGHLNLDGFVSLSSYNRAIKIARQIRDTYQPYFYTGLVEVPRWCEQYMFGKMYTLYGHFCHALRRYRSLLLKVPSLDYSRSLHVLREKFLCKLFEVPVNRDVSYLSYVSDLILNSPSPGAVFHKH